MSQHPLVVHAFRGGADTTPTFTAQSFNEPDLDTQANMTVQETLDGWEYHMQGFAKGPKPLKLVSPAVTNGGELQEPQGVTFTLAQTSPCRASVHSRLTEANWQHPAAPMGLTFLEEFMAGAKARGFVVDAIALHWYGTDFNSFLSRITEAHELYVAPIQVRLGEIESLRNAIQFRL